MRFDHDYALYTDIWRNSSYGSIEQALTNLSGDECIMIYTTGASLVIFMIRCKRIGPLPTSRIQIEEE